jgi:hypothetical protein
MGRESRMNLIYQVKVGETPAFYDECIASVTRYCERIGAVHEVQTEPILRIAPLASRRSANALRLGYLPIFEKANAFSHFGEFERIAVVDADVYVRDSAPDLFEELGAADFAGVLERELPMTDRHRRTVATYSEGQYRPLTDVDWRWDARGAAFYNMGVMLMGRGIVQHLGGTPAQFLMRPEFERFVNGEGHWRWSTDQTLLNYWVKKSGMRARDLDWRWNALFGAVTPDALPAAHFVHFFLAAKMEKGGAEIPDIIRRL